MFVASIETESTIKFMKKIAVLEGGNNQIQTENQLCVVN